MSDKATSIEDRETRGADSGVTRAPDGLLGATIDGRYRIERLLGEGGMGLVYEAIHTRLGKPLAIKVLRRENTKDPEVLSRFRREAESASAIGNQHIIDVSDFGTLGDGSTYFVMERLYGTDLIDAIDTAKRMPERRAVHIALQVCRALGAAHDAGVVHRDLKPENVFLIERDGVKDFVKVLDFGIAKVAHGPDRLTQAGEVLGTPHYMSPEQCEGEGIDHRTDIYALGVLLYEMLTGCVPHDADTMMGILTKQLYEDPIPPKVRVPEVSEELQEVIMRCLEKKPEQRYQTMHEIRAALERAHVDESPVGPRTVTMAMKTTRRKRTPPLFLAGAAVAALVLLGALALATRSAPGRAPATAGSGPRAVTAADRAIVAPDSTFAPVRGEEASLAPVDAPGEPGDVVAPDALEVPEAPKPRPTSRARRKSRPRAKPTPPRDPAILDPWN